MYNDVYDSFKSLTTTAHCCVIRREYVKNVFNIRVITQMLFNWNN